jgi:hypothetical protein
MHSVIGYKGTSGFMNVQVVSFYFDPSEEIISNLRCAVHNKISLKQRLSQKLLPMSQLLLVCVK